MKVCDVVLNSIWYDPRVRKQIVEYQANGIEVCAVGMKCARYDEEKIKTVPCKANIVCIDAAYDGQQQGILRKIKREKLRFAGVRDAIIAAHPDVIHANDLNALLPAYAAKKKLGCKLVYDSHEINTENYAGGGKSTFAKLMGKVEKYLVRRVDKMVCVSHAAADYFAAAYGIEKPMVVTNCALKKEQVDLAAVQKHEGFEVLNHGQFYEGRGYELMVDACDLLMDYPDIHLAIRGFGRLEKQLRADVEKKKNKESFVFYPSVTVQELIPKASESSVGVAITLPICLNFKLSVSNKLFEYASAGLPVIMSDIPEHVYLNNKYEFGIVLNELTAEEFAKAVIRLYCDKEFYEKCANNAKKMSLEINWENEFGKLITAEKQLMK